MQTNGKPSQKNCGRTIRSATVATSEMKNNIKYLVLKRRGAGFTLVSRYEVVVGVAMIDK